MQYDIIFLVKKILLIFLIFIGTVFFLPQISHVSAEQIQNFDSNITINKDGAINVDEKIIYDFGDLYRHGIYREIPFIKTNKEGKKFEIEFKNISVTDENGKNYRFTKTKNEEILRLKIGDPDRTITGVHTYIISYQVAGALTYFSDHDELYWNVTGDKWSVPIDRATSEVVLSDGIEKNEINTKCYTGAQGSTAQNCITSVQQNSVSIRSQDSLRVYEGMTIVVGFPKGVVAVLEPKPYVTFWETIWGKMLKIALIILAIFWYLIYPLWIPVKWWLMGRDPNVSQEVRAWFDPPKTEKGRPLTPAETGSLIDEKVDSRDISAMIVNLAQRGYFKIVEKKKNDFYLVKRSDWNLDKKVLPFEKTFMDKVFKYENEVQLKQAEFYIVAKSVTDMLYANLVSENYFPENPNSIRTFYTVIGSIAAMTFNIFLAIVAFLFGRNMPRKTNMGIEQAKVAKSLKNFLSSQERQLEFQAKNQMFFEKLLPYAVAFGVEKVWAKRFEGVQMRRPDWYEGYATSYYTSSTIANSMHSYSSKVSSATSPTSSSSGFSSGFSGGSSGGGGGGGGGGSW